jgi:hypothetical protein
MAEQDQVVEYDLGAKPGSIGGGTYVLQSEYDSFLVFDAGQYDGERFIRSWAVVTIKHCMLTKFGSPNDEGLGQHPLYKRGLSFYNVYEVLNSSFVQKEIGTHTDLHHWIFTFKDSTFECIGDELRLDVSTQPLAQVIADVTARMLPPSVRNT